MNYTTVYNSMMQRGMTKEAKGVAPQIIRKSRALYRDTIGRLLGTWPPKSKGTMQDVFAKTLKDLGYPPEMRTPKRLKALQTIYHDQIGGYKPISNDRNIPFGHRINHNYRGLATILGVKPDVVDKMVAYQKRNLDGIYGQHGEYGTALRRFWGKLPQIKDFQDKYYENYFSMLSRFDE